MTRVDILVTLPMPVSGIDTGLSRLECPLCPETNYRMFEENQGGLSAITAGGPAMEAYLISHQILETTTTITKVLKIHGVAGVETASR